MSVRDGDRIVDRRRLKRQLSAWRIGAIVAATLLLAVLAVVDPARWRGDLFSLGGDHVARVHLGGLLTQDIPLERAIVDAGRDRSVKAILVHIDSPGGTIVGSEGIYAALRRAGQDKPVVALMGEVAASGGYMVALGADRIYAREGTITGSIGVILQTTNVTGLLEKIGVSAEAIKSAPLKAVPNPLEPLTQEGRAATQILVDDMYAMFLDMVALRRRVDLDRARVLGDGRVYTGRQARAEGLIDAIGGEIEARSWLAEDAGIDRGLPTRPLRIERPNEYWADLIGGTLRVLTGKTYLAERLTLDGLMAVWHPEIWSR
jgi:protease-4